MENPPGSMVCARCGAELGEIKAEPKKPEPTRPETEPSKPALVAAPPRGRKGLIIGAAIVVIAAVSLATFVLLFKPSVGTGPGGTPVYTGATENKEAELLIQQQLENMGITDLEVGCYTSTDSPSTISNWYKEGMSQSGWTKENEYSGSSYYSGEMYYLLYKQADSGALILVGPTETAGETMIIVLVCTWENAVPLWDSITYVYTYDTYTPPAIIPTTANVSGSVIDKDNSTTDNFTNGKVIIDIQVMSGDIDNVLDPTSPMKIRLVGRGKTWSTGDLDISDSGKTEANYGATIEMGGVLDISGMSARLYVKVSVPTTSSGEVDQGMSIRAELWPTTDAASAMDGTISPASFDDTTIEDWWNEKDTIDIYITAKNKALALTGFDGAYLFGSAVDVA